MRRSLKVAVIPDTQARHGEPVKHFHAARRFLKRHKPDVVVHLGDNWDLPSLCGHVSEIHRAAQKESLRADIEAGDFAAHVLLDGVKIPEAHMLEGNHEDRLNRLYAAQPILRDMFYLDYGKWEQVPFLEILDIRGVDFSHYFYNQYTGRAYSGSAQSVLSQLRNSFVQGHKQGLDFARKDLNNGTRQTGIVAGSFYLHDEDYKGPQGNGHWRGILMLTCHGKGDFDFETISMKTLLKEYNK